jgi:hypothetical protein
VKCNPETGDYVVTYSIATSTWSTSIRGRQLHPQTAYLTAVSAEFVINGSGTKPRLAYSTTAHRFIVIYGARGFIHWRFLT